MSDPCRQCGWPFDVNPTSGLCKGCQTLKDNPDALSKRTNLAGIPFNDMKQMDEPERIKKIAEYVNTNPGESILVMVDTGEGHDGKGDRYIHGVRSLVPGVKVIKRQPGPIDKIESIVFKL